MTHNTYISPKSQHQHHRLPAHGSLTRCSSGEPLGPHDNQHMPKTSVFGGRNPNKPVFNSSSVTPLHELGGHCQSRVKQQRARRDEPRAGLCCAASHRGQASCRVRPWGGQHPLCKLERCSLHTSSARNLLRLLEPRKLLQWGCSASRRGALPPSLSADVVPANLGVGLGVTVTAPDCRIDQMWWFSGFFYPTEANGFLAGSSFFFPENSAHCQISNPSTWEPESAPSLGTRPQLLLPKRG